MKFSQPAGEAAYGACRDTEGPLLVELIGLTEEEFVARFSRNPIKRAKRRGLLRKSPFALRLARSWTLMASCVSAGSGAFSVFFPSPEPLEWRPTSRTSSPS